MAAVQPTHEDYDNGFDQKRQTTTTTTTLANRGMESQPLYVIPVVQSANMAPLGLFGFGLTTALLQGSTTTMTEPGTNAFVYAFAFGFGGLAQLLAGMWEARRGKMFGAVAFSSYGAFWISYAIFGILTATGIFQSLGPSGEGEQMLLGLWAIFTFLLFTNTLALNLALQSVFFFLTITFSLLSAGVTHTGAERAGGVFGLITAACAFYTAWAELTNDTFGRTVLPLGTYNLYTKLGLKGPSAPYDVQRTEVRGFNPQGVRNNGMQDGDFVAAPGARRTAAGHAQARTGTGEDVV